MIKATLRPLRRRARITPQQKAEAKARRDALPSNKYYLRGVEGCTYKPLKIAFSDKANSGSTYGTSELGWRDNYNASK